MTNASARKVFSISTRTTTKTIVSINSRKVSFISVGLGAVGRGVVAAFGAGGGSSGMGGRFIGSAVTAPTGIGWLGVGGFSSAMKHLYRDNDPDRNTRRSSFSA